MKKSVSDSSLQKKRLAGSVETLKVPDESRSNRSGSFAKRIKNSG